MTPRLAFDLTPMQNAHRNRGIGRYVGGLARRLVAQTDIAIEFWGWNYDRPLRVDPPHRAIWLPRYGIPRSRAPWLFAKLGTILRSRRSPARVVHFTDPRAVVRLRGRQVLTTVYDLIPLIEPGAPPGFVERCGYRHYLRQVRRVDRIFAISEQTAGDLTEQLGISRARVVIAAPGVDLAANAASPRAPSQPYFLYVGSAEPHKNVSLLMRAMVIASDLPETLVIAGTWYPEQVDHLFDEFPGLRGRAQIRGFVPDTELPALIGAATALIVPSKREGFGLPVAEGFAAGGAVIHSRIPVLMDVSEGAALTFDPSSADELAACLGRVSQQPEERARLRALGRQRVPSLTWDAAVEATLRVYRECLSR